MKNYEKIINQKMPEDVSTILQVLSGNGKESFVVGGCVRDVLLDREPNDWDITTNVTPDKVMDIFQEKGYTVVPTGIQQDRKSVV